MAIDVSRNAVGGVSDSLEKSVMKVYYLTLLSLQAGRWVSNFQGKKRYVTLEWPFQRYYCRISCR